MWKTFSVKDSFELVLPARAVAALVKLSWWILGCLSFDGAEESMHIMVIVSLRSLLRSNSPFILWDVRLVLEDQKFQLLAVLAIFCWEWLEFTDNQFLDLMDHFINSIGAFWISGKTRHSKSYHLKLVEKVSLLDHWFTGHWFSCGSTSVLHLYLGARLMMTNQNRIIVWSNCWQFSFTEPCNCH